jgi:type II secretory pathway pseudopilin PulG
VPERLAHSAGFTIVEIMVAMLLLAGGILATGAVLAQTARQSTGTEARAALAHRAQQEAERLASLSYAQLGHATLPAASSANTAEPLHWYSPTPQTYQWDRGSGGAATAEALVSSASGTVAVGPTAWSDGRLSGRLYSFVTWVRDTRCGSGCPASQNYKRVTVAVVLDAGAAGGRVTQPVYVSSLVADPRAVPAGKVVNGNLNPLADPSIQCRDASNNVVSCTQSVGTQTINQWYLTDTPATATYTAPGSDHPVHPTVAPSGTCSSSTTTGCPVPDLLSSSPPPSSTPPPPLHRYATDVAGSIPGGRVLARDVSCSVTPTATDNAKGHMWMTAPLAADKKLTGSGGMTLSSQTAGAATASVTLCLGIYSAGSIANLVQTPPVRLGVVAYTMAEWPSETTPVSFSFDFLTSGTTTVLAGQRIGVRLWVAGTSGADIAAIYDHPASASVVQLNSQ